MVSDHGVVIAVLIRGPSVTVARSATYDRSYYFQPRERWRSCTLS